MKALAKVALYLSILTVLDVVLRKGLVFQFFPSPLNPGYSALLLFGMFAAFALIIAKKFANSEQKSLTHLGISWSSKNQIEFFLGLIIGVILWGIVSLSQSYIAGFEWVWRPNFNALSLIQGLLFIFLADLGTEVYMRGYPLYKLKEGYGPGIAIILLVLFELAKSFVYNWGSELALYAILIPVLHVLFFSIIYLKTKRLGASLGIHTGANFITISIFDLRIENAKQAIPAGMFQANVELEKLSMNSLQFPWVVMAILFSIAAYFWWTKDIKNHESN